MADEHGIDPTEYFRIRAAALFEMNSQFMRRIESLADDVQNLEQRLSVAIDERDDYRKRFRETENDLIYYRSLVTGSPGKEKSLEQQIAFAFQAHAVDEFGAIMWLARVIDRMRNADTSETGLK